MTTVTPGAAVTAAVHDHIVATYAPDTEAIPHDFDLLDGGVLDSLALVSLLAWIGRRFGLPVEDLDLDPRRLHSIADIADFIAANQP
ncbi:MAG: acyl carrier protein [Catenulispora sp.]|nr:acyl carrier protein [Catenulispora sp.]